MIRTMGDMGDVSIVAGVGLEGYLSEWSAHPGEHLTAHMAGPAGNPQVEILRVARSQRESVLGDPAARRDWGQPTSISVTPRAIDAGSYIEIPHAPHLSPVGSFTFGCWICPSKLAGGWQTVAAKWAPGALSFGLFVATDKVLVAGVSLDGVTVRWCSGQEFVRSGTWQYVAMSWDAEHGNLDVFQKFTTTEPRYTTYPVTPSRGPWAQPGAVFAGTSPILLGALPSADGDGAHVAHFNGRLADPILFDVSVTADDIEELAESNEVAPTARVLGAWDFSREVSSTRIVDGSAHGHDGIAVNCPARAVIGPHYEKRPSRGEGLRPTYIVRPDLFTAVHLHDDDLDDARWPTSFGITIPADADSGLYAVRVFSDVDELYLPLVVAAPRPRARVAVLAPTFTWTAYSSNRSAHTWQCDGIADRTRCLYDVHTDGSAVFYVTRRKPSRTGNPWFKRFGGDKIIALVYMLEWLDSQDCRYDVITDDQLHSGEVDLAAQYDCLIMAGHNEYWSLSMMRALEGFTASGGRVLYLAGDGFIWVTSTDTGRPYILECRKDMAGDYNPGLPRDSGEAAHSTSLEIGGSWAGRGWRGRDLVGVEASTAVYVESDGSRGFRRDAESYDGVYGWIFEGVDEDVVGTYGDNLGSAVGHETDAVPPDSGPRRAARTVRLARASDPTWWAAGGLDHSACDLAFTEFPGGGAVFAAGSMTWSGSLIHVDGCSVSQITANVLDRFLSTPRGASVLTREE